VPTIFSMSYVGNLVYAIRALNSERFNEIAVLRRLGFGPAMRARASGFAQPMGLGYCSVKYALKRSRSKFVLAFGQPVRV
jgi:hypothetical protein